MLRSLFNGGFHQLHGFSSIILRRLAPKNLIHRFTLIDADEDHRPESRDYFLTTKATDEHGER